jgi:hypothetical protein
VIARAALVLAAAAAVGTAAGCGPRPPGAAAADPRIGATLIGEWRWVQLTEENGTRRTEDERWQFVPRPDATVAGRYLRDVTVQSTDGRVFDCNQAAEYRQRAVFELELAGDVIRELSYRTEASPCDHGFRKLGTYRVKVGEQQATLTWDGGEATLLRVGPPPGALAEPAWSGDRPTPTGAWTWNATWREPRGPRRAATETWAIAAGTAGTASTASTAGTAGTAAVFTGTVTRTLETIDPDGATIPCAGADRWTETERITVELRRTGDLYRLRELEADAGALHPCRATSPARVLDDATVEQRGDYLVIEWRGDRRQVLRRP